MKTNLALILGLFCLNFQAQSQMPQEAYFYTHWLEPQHPTWPDYLQLQTLIQNPDLQAETTSQEDWLNLSQKWSQDSSQLFIQTAQDLIQGRKLSPVPLYLNLALSQNQLKPEQKKQIQTLQNQLELAIKQNLDNLKQNPQTRSLAQNIDTCLLKIREQKPDVADIYLEKAKAQNQNKPSQDLLAYAELCLYEYKMQNILQNSNKVLAYPFGLVFYQFYQQEPTWPQLYFHRFYAEKILEAKAEQLLKQYEKQIFQSQDLQERQQVLRDWRNKTFEQQLQKQSFDLKLSSAPLWLERHRALQIRFLQEDQTYLQHHNLNDCLEDWTWRQTLAEEQKIPKQTWLKPMQEHCCKCGLEEMQTRVSEAKRLSQEGDFQRAWAFLESPNPTPACPNLGPEWKRLRQPSYLYLAFSQRLKKLKQAQKTWF